MSSKEKLEVAKARLDEATNWHQFGETHDEDGWCCKRENELRDEVHALEMAAPVLPATGQPQVTMQRARDLARSYLYGAMGHLGISVLKDEAVESVASRLFDDFSRNWWESYPLCICSHGILDHEGGPVMQRCEQCACMKYVPSARQLAEVTGGARSLPR